MQEWKRNAFLLWFAVLIVSACWSMVMPFMPLFLEQELGVTVGVATWAGVLGAVNSAGMMIMSPIWGAIGDRIGRKAMMFRAGVFLTLSYALLSLVQGPWSLLGVRVMIGVLTGFIPTAIALVGVTTPQEHVGRALALVSTAPPTGTILGPMVGGLLSDIIGMRGTMAAGAVMVGGATLLVMVTVRERFSRPADAPGFRILADMKEVLRERSFAVLMVTTALFTAAFSALDPIMVPYVKELLGGGAPNWLAGLLYSMPGIAFVVMTPFWASRGERWGYGKSVTIGLGLGAVTTFGLLLATGGWDMGAIRLAQGMASASVSPGVAALIAIALSPALRGRGFGLNQSANSVGAMIGPLFGGLLATWAGPRATFVMSGLLLVGGALWTWFVVRPQVQSLQPNLSPAVAAAGGGAVPPGGPGSQQRR